MKEYPFFRENEEFEAGLRPFIHQYFNLILFSICILAAGIITGLEKGGRQPAAQFMASEAKSTAMAEKISKLKSMVTQNYQPHPILRDFKIVEAADSLEFHFGAAALFAPGQAGLNSDGEPTLRALATVLLPVAKDYKVKIESYTDDAPILSTSTQFPSNWELSGARAARVLRIFEKAGFAKEHLTFVGLGESNPLLPNRDPAGHTLEANRLRNRRVVIRLTSI
jgi:flagellar motor protein MotB